MPETQFPTIIEEVTWWSTGIYYSVTGELMVACSDRQNMKQIRLLLGDKWVEIQPTDYLNPAYATIGAATDSSIGACRVCIKQSWDN